jgi:hypothetical protein
LILEINWICQSKSRKQCDWNWIHCYQIIFMIFAVRYEIVFTHQYSCSPTAGHKGPPLLPAIRGPLWNKRPKNTLKNIKNRWINLLSLYQSMGIHMLIKLTWTRHAASMSTPPLRPGGTAHPFWAYVIISCIK